MRSIRFFSLVAVVLAGAALIASGCGDEDGDDEPGAEVLDIASLQDSADPASGREIRIAGTSTSLGLEGFILEDATGAIVVSGLETPVGKVEDGEELEVAGRVSELDPFQIERLRRSAQEAGAADALDLAPIEAGAAYVELVSLSGEGN